MFKLKFGAYINSNNTKFGGDVYFLFLTLKIL